MFMLGNELCNMTNLKLMYPGSVDSNSVSKIQSTVNQAFNNKALSQRGTVKKRQMHLQPKGVV